MTERATIVGWVCVFLSATSISWAIAFASVYAPATPQKDAKQLCALYEAARSTAFCLEIARRGE